MTADRTGDPKRWSEVGELFDRALDLGVREREAFLAEACGDDVELLAAVQALLAVDDRPHEFLDGPVEEFAAPIFGEPAGDADDTGPRTSEVGDLDADPATAAELPRSLGRYTIVGKLGEGGMGVVYEAEQAHPKRRVALKVVRGGRFLDDVAVRMFRREADMLARLEHPNIGAIYESGRTPGGRPFFAMELVRGETLRDYLSRRPSDLTAAEVERRLRLFCSVAHAVHYAHQRGVIHRDLKPSNVIVTERERDEESASGAGLPETKILDFGLARLTEGDAGAGTMLTEVGVIKGTLAYMSPEQAAGSAAEIDLRTDVYALGVILYEMLSGERPYDLGKLSIAEAVRVICETTPRPLRQVRRETRKLDGDLETIVAKALAKEADRRYSSAAALAEDVERYLSSQPILARPPSARYLLRKLMLRNRLATALVASVLVLVVGFGISMSLLWRQSEAARSRAEGANLLSLGRLEIEASPSSALAYALASLELDDSETGRRFALETLWRGPPARVVQETPSVASTFSPDGRYLATDLVDFVERTSQFALFEHSGGQPLILEKTPPAPPIFVGFDGGSSRLLSKRSLDGPLSTWSVPEGEPLAELELEGPTVVLRPADGQSLVFLTADAEGRSVVRSWDGSDDPKIRGSIAGQHYIGQIHTRAAVDHDGSRIAYPHEGGIYVHALDRLEEEPPLRVGRHEGGGLIVLFHPLEEVLVSGSAQTGEILFWSLTGVPGRPIRSFTFQPFTAIPRLDPDGRYLATGNYEGRAWFWDLAGPPGADPVVLERAGQQAIWSVAFHPESTWLATGDNAGGAIWPLEGYPLELRSHEAALIHAVAFDPQGRWLVSSTEGGIRLWPLSGSDASGRVWPGEPRALDVDPSGESVLAAWDSTGGGVALVPVVGDAVEWLWRGDAWEAVFSPDGRYVAAGGGQFEPADAAVRVWDRASGEETVLDAGDGSFVADVAFLPDGRLAAGGAFGLRLWDLATASFESLWSEETAVLAAAREVGLLAGLVGVGTTAAQGGVVRVLHLEGGETRPLLSHGERVNRLAIDAAGETIVTGATDGVVRIGPVAGAEPHLLLGHQGSVHAVAIDPGGRWVASAGVDSVVRLWPMPAGQPVHTLPRDELLRRLRESTNYRVVVDPGTATGYRLAVDPFPGW